MKNSYVFLLTSLLGLSVACSKKEVTPDINTGTTPLVATIDGDQQSTPTAPNPSHSAAKGSFTGTYVSDTKQFTYYVHYSGMTATSAHIHTLTPGALTGPVTIPFASLADPIQGTVTLTAAQADDLLNGKMYVNIHSAAFPAGEIRGNISKQ